MNPIVKWLAGALVLVGLVAAVWIQTARLDTARAQIDIEKGNTRVAEGAAAAARMALANKELYQRQLEDERLTAEAALAELRKEYQDVRQDLNDAKSAGKGAPLSDTARSYFERVRRQQGADR